MTEKEGCGCGSNGNLASSNCGGIVYVLGFVGAAVYYISTAASFGVGVLGVLKAMVWPAYLVYGLLKLVGA